MGLELKRTEKMLVLSNLHEKEMPMTLHAKRERLFCYLSEYDRDYMELKKAEGSWTGFEEDEEVTIYFEYFGHVINFKTNIYAVEGTRLKLEAPLNIYKDLERKYVRVPPTSDIEARFIFQGTSIDLNFPKSRNFRMINKPEISPDFDDTSLVSLVQSFRNKVNGLTSENKTDMFRGRQPNRFEEEIIVHTGKALYLPHIDQGYPLDDPYPEGRIITREDLISSQEEKGYPRQLAEEKIQAVLNKKRVLGVQAEIYCPIMYNEYVTGYVYLVNKRERPFEFDYSLFDFAWEFSQALSYSLMINGYYDENGRKPEEKKYDATVIDISASGLLFAHTDPELEAKLTPYSDIELVLTIGEKNLFIGSRVIRKFTGRAMSYYGIQFIDIHNADFRFLFQYLYGYEYDINKDILWEGGAPPPPLELEPESEQEPEPGEIL